jgi:hypothetical protein
MGTRSTYRIIEQFKQKDSITNNEIVLIYCQYDGYPEGHPLQTAEWLSKGYVVNGLGIQDETLVFNGAGCLAAQLIAKMKDGAGNVYVYGMSSRSKCSEDYLYDIIIKSDRTIEYVGYFNDHRQTEFFRGTPKQFTETFVKLEEA